MRTLRTERLTLRPFRESDVGFLLDLHSRPEVSRYLGNGKPQLHPDQARRRLERYVSYAGHSVQGIWAIVEGHDDGEPCGTLLLKDLPGSGPEGGHPSGHLEIGWHLHPDAWGRGIATEAARCVIDHAWDAGLDHLLAVTAPANAASQAVCQRIGMRPLGLTTEFYDAECSLFRIDRPAMTTRH